jgi:hypothetical protein
MAVINEVTEVLHKIEAKLYPNYLGKGEGSYVARAKAEAPLSIEDVCAAAKNRGGFTGQYEDLMEALIYLMKNKSVLLYSKPSRSNLICKELREMVKGTDD